MYNNVNMFIKEDNYGNYELDKWKFNNNEFRKWY